MTNSDVTVYVFLQHVRRLEFNQAMDDFKTMFPSMDHEVIECVLRANNGAVDSTIDQLLQMSLDGQGTDDSSDSDDSIPPEVRRRRRWVSLKQESFSVLISYGEDIVAGSDCL